jgi:hypothetical protein
MPIVQFKHRPARVDAGLPELGRLFKGAPRQSENQKQVPPDLDYFRFEAADLPTASADQIDAAWVALYGDKPKIIRNVQFAVDRLDLAFDSWLESWDKSRNGAPLLNRRCDGQTIVFERDGDKVYREPAVCEHKCDCKPVGRLRLFLPELCAKLGVLGVATLVTHGGTDIDNIVNSLGLVLSQTGRLRNVAFVLYRESVQLMTPAGLPVQKSIVRLELDTRSAQAVALAAGDMPMLPSNVSANVPANAPVALPENVPANVPPLVHDEDGVVGDSFATDYDKFDENGDDLPEQPDGAKLLGRAITAETRAVNGGKSKAIDLTLTNGAVVTLYTRDPLRALSPLWADTVKAWDKAGKHAFRNVAGEVDVYSDGKDYAFVIPAEFESLHAQPQEG